MELLEGILTRRSIRKFTGEPLEDGQLEKLIRAGMYAPSAHNLRPWRFVTVEDRAVMRLLRPMCRWWQMLDQAAVTIAVSADPAGREEMNADFETDDCGAAIQNILLAAHALGLGAVWLGLTEKSGQAGQVKQLLGIPDGFHIKGLIAVGRPAQEPSVEAAAQPKRFEAEKWSRERWEQNLPL